MRSRQRGWIYAAAGTAFNSCPDGAKSDGGFARFEVTVEGGRVVAVAL
jgi:hypothetical protein